MDVWQSIRRRTTASWRLRYATRWLEQSGLGKVLDNEGGALKPQAYDLWNLYQNVRKRKPNMILEFGVGHSTIVMAEAQKQNGFGDIVSIDASPRWFGRFNAQCPARLSERIHLFHCPIEVIEHEGERCHRYTGVPDIVPNFMYLDGPDAKDVPGWGDESQIAADPVLMEGVFLAGFRLVVDTRLKNCEFLDRHFRKNYRKTYDDIFKIVTYDLLP